MSPGGPPVSSPSERQPDPSPEQIELVAAALADDDLYPEAWEDINPHQRAIYRDHALDLLIKGDPWSALQGSTRPEPNHPSPGRADDCPTVRSGPMELPAPGRSTGVFVLAIVRAD